MSVTDPIRIGALRLEPQGFHGDKVAIKLEQDGPPLDGEQSTVSVVRDLRDMNTIPPQGMQVETCVPLLDIRTWESLQAAAALINVNAQGAA